MKFSSAPDNNEFGYNTTQKPHVLYARGFNSTRVLRVSFFSLHFSYGASNEVGITFFVCSQIMLFLLFLQLVTLILNSSCVSHIFFSLLFLFCMHGSRYNMVDMFHFNKVLALLLLLKKTVLFLSSVKYSFTYLVWYTSHSYWIAIIAPLKRRNGD